MEQLQTHSTQPMIEPVNSDQQLNELRDILSESNEEMIWRYTNLNKNKKSTIESENLKDSLGQSHQKSLKHQLSMYSQQALMTL